MVYKSGHIFLPFCHNSRVWQTDRRTDGRTDIILIARPRLHSMQRGKNGLFPIKIALCLMKVCYKVSLCKNCQRQSCTAFIGLSIRAKMIGGGVAFYMKICRLLTHPLCKTPIFNLFLLVAPQPWHLTNKFN